jgi:hypothetical protein
MLTSDGIKVLECGPRKTRGCNAARMTGEAAEVDDGDGQSNRFVLKVWAE